MKSEDEIMAEYLLKGGKMLSKTCPACGCPLFEYKDETFCVVCREEQAGEGGSLQKAASSSRQGTETKMRKEKDVSRRTGLAPDLVSSIEETITILSQRVREEPDPERVLVLMNAIKRGVEVVNLLR